jgi:hypothetical protein
MRFQQCFLAAIAVLSISQATPAQSLAQKAAPPNGFTMTGIIGALQDSGYQAKQLEATPPANMFGQILTGVAGIKMVVGVYKCAQPNAQAICLLSFTSFFTDVTDVSKEGIATLNDASFAHVANQIGPDGKSTGVRVNYVYPCEGFQDAQFVPMVLKDFSLGVGAVVTAYRTMKSPAPAATAIDLPTSP